jgi:hypothetical protein
MFSTMRFLEHVELAVALSVASEGVADHGVLSHEQHGLAAQSDADLLHLL